jgi:hypothetical protein
MGGEAIRWIDLPAVRKGRSTIFDLAPTKWFKGDEASWAKGKCVKMRKAIETHHGVPVCKFIELFMADRETFVARLEALSRLFLQKVSRESDSPSVKHFASSFAHIYASGVLAVELGILPWSKKLVLKSIKRCYFDARRAMRSPDVLLRSGLKLLRKKLDGDTLVTVGKRKPLPNSIRKAEGFVVTTGMGQKVTVRAEKFKNWFADRRQPRLVLDWLSSKGCITLSRGGKPASGNAVVWAESQPTWPHGPRPRSIVLDLPLSVRNSLPQ